MYVNVDPQFWIPNVMDWSISWWIDESECRRMWELWKWETATLEQLLRCYLHSIHSMVVHLYYLFMYMSSLLIILVVFSLHPILLIPRTLFIMEKVKKKKE